MSAGAPAGPLPPGQVETRKFPVVGERLPPEEATRPEAWRLVVDGRVRRPFSLSWPEILALPREEVVADLHCVTGWSRRGTRFVGTRLGPLLDRADPLLDARFVRFEALSARRHDTSLPLAVARSGTWLVHGLDGGPLPPEHGGPLRTLTPALYLYKSLKWLRRVEVLTEDRLGFWERDQGYHNEADPWREQRYVTGDLSRDDLEALRRARRLAPFRGRLVLGADLRGWDPADRDLRGLRLKNTDLREARLAGADIRDANLCFCDLRRADLRGADLRGADLEGVRLAGADLVGADLRGASLLAATFVGPAPRDLPARVTGMRWTSSPGLLEGTLAFLSGSDALAD